MKSILWLLLTLNPHGAVDVSCVKHVVAPGYPHLARAAQLQGTVTVEIDIDPDGTVTSKRSSGSNELLRRASEDNAAQWTFCPVSGATGPRKQSIIYIYKLEGPKEYPCDSAIVLIDLPNHWRSWHIRLSRCLDGKKTGVLHLSDVSKARVFSSAG